MIDIKKFVNENKAKITEVLYDWAYTFQEEVDEDGEPIDEPFNTVFSLVERLKNDKLTAEDYKEIEFHIFQINYDEVIIDIGYESGIMP